MKLPKFFIRFCSTSKAVTEKCGWTDEKGHVFIFFPIKNLAEAMHKSEMSIKTALMALEKENLIVRKRQGAGFPNRIYVKYPPEYLTADGQKSFCKTDRKLSY